jgi:anti-sigma B factor antagonist
MAPQDERDDERFVWFAPTFATKRCHHRPAFRPAPQLATLHISRARRWESGMEWADSVAGDACVGRPRGRIDETSWETFFAGIAARIGTAADAKRGFVLDLADVDYMSSRGLRALTLARREADARGVSLSLARPNERMREILAISRYDRIFTVADALPGGSG